MGTVAPSQPDEPTRKVSRPIRARSDAEAAEKLIRETRVPAPFDRKGSGRREASRR